MSMNLQYKGVNQRSNRVEWLELDLIDSFYPEGKPIEEWQIPQYRNFVEDVESNIGRSLTKRELGTVFWLSGYEKSTINDVMTLVKAAFDHGKVSK